MAKLERMVQRMLACALGLLLGSTTVAAGEAVFIAQGTVATALGASGAYSGVQVGQSAELRFTVTTPGTDIVPGQVTAYSIDPASLSMVLGPVSVGGTGGTPTAQMRNADPVADGVLMSASVTGPKTLSFSFSDCSGTIFSSTDPLQNLGLWSGFFYCSYSFSIMGGGTFIEMDLTSFAIELPSLGTPLCFGDGTQSLPCPCANNGLAGHGCDNSAATGGALLSARGSTAADTVVLSSSGELPTVLSIFLQGNALTANPLPFGDGLRCAGGTLKRLYVKNASGGAVSAPMAGDNSIQVQSALLGDTITPGTSRWYQVYYRDPNLTFCAAPSGSSFNVSNALEIAY